MIPMVLSHFRFGAASEGLCRRQKRAVTLDGEKSERDVPGQAEMAARSRRTAINAITRLMLSARTCKAISVRTFVSRRIRKRIAPKRRSR